MHCAHVANQFMLGMPVEVAELIYSSTLNMYNYCHMIFAVDWTLHRVLHVLCARLNVYVCGK